VKFFAFDRTPNEFATNIRVYVPEINKNDMIRGLQRYISQLKGYDGWAYCR
jgi:hypothetical protein